MGSKYDDETREKALAMCAMPKMNAGKVAKAMGIPRATVYDWQKTAQENDPDFQAVRRNKLRKMMDRAYSIVGRSMDGLDAQSKALALEKSEIETVILKILADGKLDEATRQAAEKIVREYTGTGMGEIARVAKEAMGIYEKLEGKLQGGESGADEVHVQLTLVDPRSEDTA